MRRTRTLCTRSSTARAARASRTPLESLERRTLFAAGDPDPAFGFGGYTAADFGDGTAYATDIAASAQRIVVVGTLQQDNFPGNVAVAAFRHDGSVDSSFSGDGKLVTDLRAYPHRVAIRGDGKILVSANVPDENGRTVEAVVLRFNADGSPDATFGGGDGRVSSPVAGVLSLAPGNKVVVGGQRVGGTTSQLFSVARLNPDGSLDASFDGDGVADHRFDTGGETGHWTATNAVAVQGDGKVVLAGTVYGSSEDDYWDGGVARLNADGSVDNTFGGGDGRVVLSFGYVDDFATAVTVAPDGSLLVGAVEGENHAMPIRLSPDGTTRDRFTPGFERSSYAAIRDLHVDGQGRVVATGYADLGAPDGGTPYNYFLGRYRGDGDGMDPGFGGYASGRFVYVPGNNSALAPDDAMLVAQDVSNDGAFRVYRYLAGGGEDASGAATMAGGTLTVTGTSRGDEIRVEPGGAPGRVVLRVNGYERSFTGVSAISISAGDGDDDVRVSEQVTLPTTVFGGAGDDRLEGGGGDDRLDGGDGRDNFNGFAGNDEIYSGPGGGSLRGGEGDDRLVGGDDDDSFSAEPGADHMSGGGGTDFVSYLPRTADLRIDLDGVADDGEVGENDNVLPDVEHVYGGSGNDLIVGSAGNNHLEGGERGNDTVRGLGGDDFLQGYSTFVYHFGNDLLEGGDGDDRLRGGGPGRADGFSTTLLGGNGNDDLYVEPDDTYDAGPGNDTINGVREDGVPTSPASHIYLDQDTDTLYVHTRHGGNDSVQLVRDTGSQARFPDTLAAIIRHADGTLRRVDVPYGDVRKINVSTESGDDRVEMALVTIPAAIDVGAGNDTVTAGTGSDTIVGGTGNDSINGNAGDDTIEDTDGTNAISGGLGTDTINGVRETPAGDSIYQAEDATVFGARVRTGNRGYTGSGYVDFDHARGDFVRWNVTADRAGTHALTFRYANGGSSDRPLRLTVNGRVVAARLSFPPTGSWATWRTVTAEVPLNAGNNSVALTAVGFGGPNVDSLTVRAADEPPPAGDSWTIQGEDALIAEERDATVRSTHPGYTGLGYLDFSRDLGATVQWDFDEVPGPGEYEIEFRYANGGAGPRTLNFQAGNGPVRTLTFAPTGAWSTWGTVRVPATLSEGNMLSVSLDTIGGDGPNIDSVTLRRISPPQALELQAEQARMSGARVKSSNGGFSGTGYADFDNPAGDWVEWAFEQPSAGRRTLTFRYANGSLTDRALELSVNGQVVAPRLSFAPTGSWSTWREVSVTVDLAAGANRVRLTSVGNSGPNVDVLTVR